ncbi:MAG: HAD-IIA family hydrolase [Aggregatilineales bacterium]
MKFSKIRGVVMDMDGVLWRGDQPLEGIVELFQWLGESELPFVLATNNSSKTQADYVAKLARMGVEDVSPERIITSATATADYLSTQYPAGTRVYVVGEKGIRQALDNAGFDVVDEGEVQIVVAGIDFSLTYDKLKTAALYIRAGADFVGTNPDVTFPSPEGLVPGAGSVIGMIEIATDKKATIIGKPGKPMFETALAYLGTSPEDTLMIGDRLDTDIRGARDAGMKTALVFTGVTQPEELTQPDNDVWSDVAYEGLPELIKAWAGDKWYLDKLKIKRGRA